MKKSIVLDLGSHISKAGFSDEEHPRTFFPSMIGEIENSKQALVGDVAFNKRSRLKSVRYPITNGIFTDNDDDVELIFNHIFYKELNIIPSDHNIVMSESPCNPTTNRERASVILFEGFNIPGFIIFPSGVLTLYSEGKQTGLVIDSGHGTTHVTPIYEGYAIQEAVMRTDLAGDSVTKFLAQLIRKRRGIEIPNELAKDIKEVHGCILNGDEENITAEEYTLPDGRRFKIREEKYLAPDLLFRPKLIGFDQYGVHRLVRKSVHKCEMDTRRGLYGSVLLTGGSTLFRGFDERLRRYLIAKVGRRDDEDEDDEFFGFRRRHRRRGNINIRVTPSALGQLSVWNGGRVIANMGRRDSIYVTKKEYEEFGFQIIHKKMIAM